MIIVNGNTWPFQTVEQRRYRFRVLNGCQSRFLILDFNQIPGVEVWAIGNEGGFLAAPVNLTADQRQPAADGPGRAGRPDRRLHQRAAWATTCSPTSDPTSRSEAASPGDDFDRRRSRHDRSDHAVPGRSPPSTVDDSTPPQFLQLPAITLLPAATVTRPLALLEEMSKDFDDAPAEALLGTVEGEPNVAPGVWSRRLWMDKRSPRIPRSAPPRCGSFTTPPQTPTRCTSTRPTFKVLNRQAIVVNEATRLVQVVCRMCRPRRSHGRAGSRTPGRSPTPAK